MKKTVLLTVMALMVLTLQAQDLGEDIIDLRWVSSDFHPTDK